MKMAARSLLWALMSVAALAVLGLLALLWRDPSVEVPQQEAGTEESAPRDPSTDTAPAETARKETGSGEAAVHAGDRSEAAGEMDLGQLFRPDGSGELPLDARTLMGLQVLHRQLPREDSGDPMARAAEVLREELPSPASRTALELLRTYTEYQRERETLFPPGSEPEGPEAARARLERLARLRRRHFSEREAEALFGTDEAHARYYLDAMEIQEDPDLDEEERERRIEALRSRLPDEASELRRRPEQGRTLRERVEELRARGAPESRIQHLREQELGVEAAEELREAEQRQAEWDRQYRRIRERARHIVEAGLSEDDRDEQLDALLREHYPESRIPAVRTMLERDLEAR